MPQIGYNPLNSEVISKTTGGAGTAWSNLRELGCPTLWEF